MKGICKTRVDAVGAISFSQQVGEYQREERRELEAWSQGLEPRSKFKDRSMWGDSSAMAIPLREFQFTGDRKKCKCIC